MKISDFIGEATEYDKKEMLEERRPRSWLKSVSAFANGIGGALIFGVSDEEILVGLTDARAVSEKISETIKTKMDPIPQVIMENHVEDEKEFVILRVLPGQETPYYYIADGNRVAYVRVGNESIPADATALKRLVLRGTNMTYDSVVSSYMLGDFSFTKLRSVYRMRTGTELSDSDFISFELADESGKLTNAGALLADDSPMRHSRLFCTRWYGSDKASGVIEALDDKEYNGSLVSLLQNGTEFVKNNTKKRWKKTGTGRVEMPEYPEQAVHETLVNALIHRDYMEIGSEVHIDIFDDRMEIYSPGGMFDGSIVQNLDTDNVASKRRNPVIADIFSRMHFMERRGSGFKKIKADYRHAVNYRSEVEPLFKSTPTSFFVTLYNLNYNVPVEKMLIDPEKVAIDGKNVAIEIAIEKLNASQNTIRKAIVVFEKMGIDGIFGRSDIAAITNDSVTAAGNLITKLKNAGLIEAVNGYGKGKYKFTGPKE
ncbi:ATP-binding protein [Enterocloster asparagiformis]|uniref:ATP-binding protein n=1 Tax=Enterocloster asparagiformis TaxID=333367 RepID=UPI000467B771|nr:ATP-binding protein [Enterocloster asparagiformis]